MMDKLHEYPIEEQVVVYINQERPTKKNFKQVLPRFELGSLDSKSKVLTATP